MADLTQQVDLTTAWLEVTRAAGMNAGTTYVLDISRPPSGVILVADTDTAAEPTDAVIGHPWYQADDQREYEAQDGRRLWMRTQRGTASIAITGI